MTTSTHERCQTYVTLKTLKLFIQIHSCRRGIHYCPFNGNKIHFSIYVMLVNTEDYYDEAQGWFPLEKMSLKMEGRLNTFEERKLKNTFATS